MKIILKILAVVLLLGSVGTAQAYDPKFHTGDIVVVDSGLDEGRTVKILKVLESVNNVTYVVTDAVKQDVQFYGAYSEDDLAVYRDGVHIHLKTLDDDLTDDDLRKLRKTND